MAPTVPYPQGTLKVPLTQAQYDGIINYLVAKSPGSGSVAEWKHLYSFGNADMESALIQQYQLAAFGSSGGKTPGKGAIPKSLQPFPGSPLGGNPLKTFNSIADAVSAIAGAILSPQFWLRIGEFLLGVLLLGVGAAKLTGTANVASRMVKAEVGKMGPSSGRHAA